MSDWAAYEAVLSDLRSQQSKLQTAIDAIEALRPRERMLPVAVVSHSNARGDWAAIPSADAAKAVLQSQPQKAWAVGDIYHILSERGVNIANANILSSILSRRAKEKEDIVRVGRGLWSINTPAARELALSPDDSDDDDIDI